MRSQSPAKGGEPGSYDTSNGVLCLSASLRFKGLESTTENNSSVFLIRFVDDLENLTPGRLLKALGIFCQEPKKKVEKVDDPEQPSG